MDKKLIKSTNRIKLVYMRDFVLAFMKWQINQEKSFAIFFREELKRTGLYDQSFDMRKIIEEIEYYFKTSLCVQAFVYFNELVKNGNFDQSLKKSKYDFKTLKSQIDVDGIEKTTNSIQLIAIIREAFAHNNDNGIANWFVENGTIVIQSKKDKLGNRHNIKINAEIIVQLLLMYLENVNWSGYDSLSLNISLTKLKNSLKNNTLTPAQVGKIFKPILSISKQQEMDKNQQMALFNCLTRSVFFKDDNFEHINEKLLLMLFPLKENAYLNGCDIMDTTMYVNEIHKNYTSFNKFINSNAKLFTKNKEEFNLPKHQEEMMLFMFGESNRIASVMINNLLFYMFTFESENNLKKCFREDLNIKRIRNSLMHGRYFYNYNSEYVFYDGIKEMEHIATISCKEIMESIDILVDNYTKERDSKKEI